MGKHLKLSLDSESTVQNPTWSQIHEALERMDGQDHNMVFLALERQADLAAGGGNMGRYIVNYQPQYPLDAPSYTLADPSLSGPDVELTVQTPAPFPSRHCVYLPLVVQAFKYFYNTGEMAPDLTWEADY